MKLYLLLLFTFFAYGGCLPEGFPTCQRNDPEIEKCILKGIEDMKPRLKDGISEINLPQLDPFYMERLVINQSITGAKIKSVLTDVIAYGGSDFEIKYLKVDLSDNQYKIDMEIVIPQLVAMANYNTRGSKMLFFSVTGRGKFKGNFKTVSIVAKCTAVPTELDGVEYLQLADIVTSVVIDDGELDIDPAEWSLTGSATSSFVRSSPSLILKALSPVIDEVTATIVKKYVNDVLYSIPRKEVLLD